MWPGLEADTFGDFAQILVDRQLYADAAVFKAAYWFTDRCYIYLDSRPDNRLAIEIRLKDGFPELLLQGIAGEFCNALVDYRVRSLVLVETNEIRHALVTKAFTEGLLGQNSRTDPHRS